MAILITNIKTPFHQPEEQILEKAVSLTGIPKSKIISVHLYKKSLDARKQNQIQCVSSVILHADIDEQKFCERCNQSDIHYQKPSSLTFTHGTEKLSDPVVIAGFGPAGIFCAYALAKEGYQPIVIERGYNVDRRVEAVENFWKYGRLNPQCNVQFGEGGAGTFSDGKLTTRISDSRCSYLLDLFVQFGAPKEILTKAKPHIGTDHLRGVIKNLRKEICALGGQVLFEHQLEQLLIRNQQLYGIIVNGQQLATQNLVLAVGHSARDTFSMLLQKNVFLEAKSFSVGVRIEHLQTQINRGLYGKLAEHPSLPQGEYQLSYRQNGRGVYTFCMCPGGFVVPSSSSPETVVTNGMSEFQRNQPNANAALVVSVSTDDFGTKPLDGVCFQSELEHKAFIQAGKNYSAPAVTVDQFLQHRSGIHLKTVTPSYALGVTACDFDSLLPKSVTEMMRTGLRNFERKIKGFSAPDAVLTGVETRTSSPVRITRNSDFQSLTVKGIYPCGEGAGYAGGIMSAAVDGLKIAEAIISRYAPR